MHKNSYELMEKLLRKIAKPGFQVLDVGSKRHLKQATYKTIVESFKMKYTGFDAEEGECVDIVGDVYCMSKRPWMHLDIVISGQMLEHLEHPREAVDQMCSILKPGGMIILIAPYVHTEHRYPIDCWRFLPDGMKSLLRGLVSEVQSNLVGNDCWATGVK